MRSGLVGLVLSAIAAVSSPPGCSRQPVSGPQGENIEFIEPYVVRPIGEIAATENPLELYIVPQTSLTAQPQISGYSHGFIYPDGSLDRRGENLTLQEVVYDIKKAIEDKDKEVTGLLFHANSLTPSQRAFVARELGIPKVAYVPPAFDDI